MLYQVCVLPEILRAAPSTLIARALQMKTYRNGYCLVSRGDQAISTLTLQVKVALKIEQPIFIIM